MTYIESKKICLKEKSKKTFIFRRALKATFVLIPLFGVQLAVTIYRPPPESHITVTYERISDVISNSQVC